MLTREEKFMKAAIKEGKKAYQIGEVPIGCVIVKDNKIIARGYNKRNTRKSSLHHAELIAIGKACKVLNDWRLEDCEIYVTIEPCPMCAGAIIQSRLKRLYYGALNRKAGSVDSIVRLLDIDQYNHQVESVAGILEEECSQLMKDFFRELRESKLSKSIE